MKQYRDNHTADEVLCTVNANYEHHIHTEKGSAELDVKSELHSTLSFPLLATSALCPVK